MHDRKTIAKKYLKSWFVLDLLSILPLDYFLRSSDEASLVKLSQINKLAKLFRMVRLFKLLKQSSKLLSYIKDFLKVSPGFERLFGFLLTVLLVCHVTSCLWIIAAQMNGDLEETWMYLYRS